jgi:hypothetical protein
MLSTASIASFLPNPFPPLSRPDIMSDGVSWFGREAEK